MRKLRSLDDLKFESFCKANSLHSHVEGVVVLEESTEDK